MFGTELIQLIRQADNADALASLLNNYILSGRMSHDRVKRLTIAGTAVQAFVSTNAPILIADLLSRLGEEVIPPLVALVEQPGHSEAKLLASLILLQRSVQTGVPLLLQEIESGGAYYFAAARALTGAGIRSHIPFLIDYARKHPIGTDNRFPTPEQCDLLATIRLLAEMDARIPADLYHRLVSSDAPAFVRDEAAQLHLSATND